MKQKHAPPQTPDPCPSYLSLMKPGWRLTSVIAELLRLEYEDYTRFKLAWVQDETLKF